MSEAPKNSMDSSEQCQDGPDFFGFYAHQIANLLSEDDNTPGISNASEFSQGKLGVVNGKETMDSSLKGDDSLFESSFGSGVSYFKKGRLKGLLRQSVKDLSKEVDEMLDPVVNMSELRYKLRSNSSMTSSSCSLKSITGNSCPDKSETCKEKEDDLEFLLKNSDQLLVEETVKKYSDELSSTLVHMEKKLEETLDAIMSKCRPMTLAEKRQLQKLIQKLPKENLVRVAEIIQRDRPAGNPCGEEIFVDLEKEENVTLWRLYHYVEAAEKAKMLAQLQSGTTPT